MLLKKAQTIVKKGSPPPTIYAKQCEGEVPCDRLSYRPSYEMYPYQRQAAGLLEQLYNGQKLNILCASPTGSGKSLLLKYCAQLAVKHQCKLRIAVPLVALAEQQYADLCNMFRATPTVDMLFEEEEDDGYYDDEYYYGGPALQPVPTVGLWTGPTQENETDALICVCTYEIINIQLDKNPHWMDNCPVLAIDEIHSMNDERGHVLETMLTHPQLRSHIVALSGTIPNAKEVAENIGKTNQSPCYILGHPTRPITLQYHLDIGYEFRKVGMGMKLDDEAWKKANEDLYTEKLPDKLSFNQMKTRLINMVYRLRKEEMLPAMCVAFSCRKLNRMADAVRGIDLLHEKKDKWKVRILFKRLEKRMGEDYVLIRELTTLAQKGIVLHHGQMCKHYLETVSIMAQHNLAKLIFCTSTLSTGINLPVKTAILTSSKMPSRHGMVTLPSSLFFQICGRAGRPGCGESIGLVVLCQWEDSMHWKDIFEADVEHVQGPGVVNPRTILNCFTFDSIDTEQVLCRSPFSCVNYDHLLPLYKQCLDHISMYPSVYAEQAKYKLLFLRVATKCREIIHRWVRDLCDGMEVLVDAPFPSMHPYRWRFKQWINRPLLFEVYESDEPCRSTWVLDVKREIGGMVLLDTMLAVKEMRRYIELVLEGPFETIPNCYDMVEAVEAMERQYFTPVFGAKYEHIVRKLQTLGYLKNHIPTAKGRLVSALLAVEDPVTLVECWYQHILPRNNVHQFVSGLTCFLVGKKHDDSHNDFCHQLSQKSDEVDLCDQQPGSSYMGPIYQWSSGKSIVEIVETYGVNPGHLCKVVQRLCQLLQQLASAARTDHKLTALCNDGLTKVKRGLPFVKSMFL